MDNGSLNGHASGDREGRAEHRAEHYLNLVAESFTLLLEDSDDEDDVDDVIDSVLLELVDAIASQGFRLPHALMDAVSGWVGTEDPRPYLRANYVDERGEPREGTPEQILAYLRASDSEYWPDD